MPEVERDESAPIQPEPNVEPDPTETSTEGAISAKVVYLPQLIADEYGMSMSEARLMAATGEIEVDGEQYIGDPLDLPVDVIDGKTIRVKGGVKTVQFQYRSEGRRDRMTGDRLA